MKYSHCGHIAIERESCAVTATFFISQRAFRERKERRVRDLEAKLSALETSASSLESDNERLRILIRFAKNENDALRANITSSRSQRSSTCSSDSSYGTDSNSVDVLFPLSPRALDPVCDGSSRSTSASCTTPSNSSSSSQSRQEAVTALSAGAVWDFIRSHPLVIQGLVDVGDVCDRLKTQVRCDERGFSFRERDAREAVQGCRRCERDELI